MTEMHVIRRAADALAARNRDVPYTEHEATARAVLASVETDLVLRCLYDSVVAELQRVRGVA